MPKTRNLVVVNMYQMHHMRIVLALKLAILVTTNTNAAALVSQIVRFSKKKKS